MQSLIQQIFIECYSVPGIVQCDRNKTGKVPWSLHFIGGVNFSHLSDLGHKTKRLQAVLPSREDTFYIHIST